MSKLLVSHFRWMKELSNEGFGIYKELDNHVFFFSKISLIELVKNFNIFKFGAHVIASLTSRGQKFPNLTARLASFTPQGKKLSKKKSWQIYSLSDNVDENEI